MPRDRDTTRYGFPPEGKPFAPFPAEPPFDTPVVDLGAFWLAIECAEHGNKLYPLRLMAANVGWQKTLRQIIPKLRCDKCGKAPISVTLLSDPAGDAGRHGARVLKHRMG